MSIKRVSVSLLTAALGLASQGALAHGNGRWFDDDGGLYERGYERRFERDFDRRERDFDRRERYARVIDVDPIVDHVRVVMPYQDCRRDWQHEPGGVVMRRNVDPGPAILGGIAGAVIGHNVVADRDRGFGTVAGAIVGGALGSSLGDRGYREEYVPPRRYAVERCAERPVERWQDRVVGYRVTYLMEGRTYTTQLPYDPGRRLRVDVVGRPF